MKNKDVVELRKEFDKVIIKHFRPENPSAENPQGTMAILQKDGLFHVGVARCDHRDQFNRRRGRLIALGRAYQNYRLSDLLPKKGKATLAKTFNSKEEIDKLFVEPPLMGL